MNFDSKSINGENDNIKLTIEEIRKFKGFETISEAEAENIIDSLLQLAVITYNLKIEKL